jgi:hypothetical protein
VTIHFKNTRFVSDLAVSGTGVWSRTAFTVTANVTLTGAAAGHLTLTWPTNVQHAEMHVAGTVNGQIVGLTMRAP